MKTVRSVQSLVAIAAASGIVAVLSQPGVSRAEAPKEAAARVEVPNPAARGAASLVTEVRYDAKKELVSVPVTIDISSVQLDNRAAVLGAYVVSMRFDREKVEFVRAEGGSDSHFSKVPSSTPAAKANANGWVKIVEDQDDTSAPTGAIHVANVVFREKVAGGAATIKARIDSLSSTLQKDATGRFLPDLHIPIDRKSDKAE